MILEAICNEGCNKERGQAMKALMNTNDTYIFLVDEYIYRRIIIFIVIMVVVVGEGFRSLTSRVQLG